jgi:hypothetical protein
MSDYLSDLVVAKLHELGTDEGAKFFGIGEPLARQWRARTKPVSLAAVQKVFSPPDKASQEASWEGKKVLLMLPWYKTTNPLTSFCLLALFDRSKMGAAMEFGDAMIAHARNRLLDTLVTTGIEHGFFLDDDMVVPCGNAAWFNRYTGMALPETYAGLHTLNRLVSHGKTLVSGLYFQRRDGGRAVYYDALVETPAGEAENREARTAPRPTLKETEWAGTGCLLVHRSVPLDIRKNMPWLAPKAPGESWGYFSSSSDTLQRKAPEVQALLENAAAEFAKGGAQAALERSVRDAAAMIESALRETNRSDRLPAGEDEVFGRRAKLCGHPTFVDYGVVCGHVGGKVFGVR